MSGLMVSLAVVVAAILAVLVLVFSDQPATEHVRRLRGGRTPISPPPQVGNGAVAAHAATPLIKRGPPPAMVLQQQLALPAARPRLPPPLPAPPARRQQAPVFQPAQWVGSAETEAEPEPSETEDARTSELTIPDDRTFLTRVRSSLALVVLLTLVGALVAFLIGAALFLAELAIQNTVG